MRTPLLAILTPLAAMLTPPTPAHSPHDVVDAVALSPDFATDHTLFVASDGSINVFLVSRDGGVTWREARNGLRGVRVKRVRFTSDYATSGEVLALTDAGFQLSVDRGATWDRTVLEHRWLVDCAFPPVRPAGRALALFYGTGDVLWRSDDRGRSEVQLDPPLGGAHIVSIAVSPDFWSDDTVAVTTDDARLLLSTDGGAHWASTALAAAGRHVVFSGHYRADGRMWIASWGAGVLSSDDRGATFTSSGPSLTDVLTNELAVVDAPSPGAVPTVIYAGTREAGLFQSFDGGATWGLTSLQPLLSTQTTNHFLHVATSSAWATDQTIACGMFEGLFLSDDAGTTWTEAIINPTRAGRLVALPATFASDDTLFGAGYGMPLIRSASRGDRWELVWRGFLANTLYALGPSADFANDRMVLVGGGSVLNQGTTMYRSIDGGGWFDLSFLPLHPNQWDPWNDGSGAEIKSIAYSPEFARDRTVFALSHVGVVYRSTDAGVNWSIRSEPMAPVDCWTKQLVLAPEFATSGEMFAVGTGLYRSTDAGATFTAVHPDTFAFLAMPPDHATSGESYIANYDGVFGVLTDDGATFTPSTDGLDGFTVVAIACSPAIATDGTILVSTSGGGIFESIDRGRHWARVSAPGSVADSALSFAMSPDFHRDGTLFAGTFEGHARSTDAGRTWRVVTEFDVYDDARDPWTFTGAWMRIAEPEAMKRDYQSSTVAGSTASLRFVGHKVELYGPAGPDQGIAEVRIDGLPIATIDTYRPLRSPHALVFRRHIQFGPHVVELLATGTKNPLASEASIGIDSATIAYGTTGSYLLVGGGCVSSTDEIPTNEALGADPTLGETLRITIDNVPTGPVVCALLLGLDELSGVDLGPIGAPGCLLFTDVLDFIAAPIGANGAATVDLVIPAEPELLGAVFFSQPILLDAGANALGIALGDARRAFLGLPVDG